MLHYKHTYRRHLPHVQPPGATLFVTFRLAGSLPAEVVAALEEEARAAEKRLQQITDPVMRAREADREPRRHFGRWDAALDKATAGPTWLSDPAVAGIVAGTLHHLNGNLYDLDTYCIMRNHGHLVMTPLEQTPGQYVALARIMHSLKRYTAWQANQHLGRSGRFWQHESYDHVVRDEAELNRIRRYVLNNPVKAGLVSTAEEWPWSYAAWL